MRHVENLSSSGWYDEDHLNSLLKQVGEAIPNPGANFNAQKQALVGYLNQLDPRELPLVFAEEFRNPRSEFNTIYATWAKAEMQKSWVLETRFERYRRNLATGAMQVKSEADAFFGPFLAEAETRPAFVKNIQQIVDDLGEHMKQAGQSEHIESLKRFTNDLPHDDIDGIKRLISDLETVHGYRFKRILATGTVASTILVETPEGQKLAVKVYKEHFLEYVEAEKARIEARTDMTSAQKSQWLEISDAVLKEWDPVFEHKATQQGGKWADYYRRDGFIVAKTWLDPSSRRVLVQEFVEGDDFSKSTFLDEADEATQHTSEERLKSLQREIAKAQAQRTVFGNWIAELFSTGFAHGDPHSGNLKFEYTGVGDPPYKVGILDWGRIIDIQPSHRSAVFAVLTGIGQGDVEAIMKKLPNLMSEGSLLENISPKVVEVFASVEGEYWTTMRSGLGGVETKLQGAKNPKASQLYEDLKTLNFIQTLENLNPKTPDPSAIASLKQNEKKFLEFVKLYQKIEPESFKDQRSLKRIEMFMKNFTMGKPPLPFDRKVFDVFKSIGGQVATLQTNEGKISQYITEHLSKMENAHVMEFTKSQIESLPKGTLIDLLLEQDNLAGSNRIVKTEEYLKLDEARLRMILQEKLEGLNLNNLRHHAKQFYFYADSKNMKIARIKAAKRMGYNLPGDVWEMGRPYFKAHTGVSLPSSRKIKIGAAGVAAALLFGAGYIVYDAIEGAE